MDFLLCRSLSYADTRTGRWKPRHLSLPGQQHARVPRYCRRQRLAWFHYLFIQYVAFSLESESLDLPHLLLPPRFSLPPRLARLGSAACDAGFTLCGTSFCIPTGSQCVSGIPARRRSLTQQAAAGELCPAGLQACYTADMASLAMGKSVGYECVDVATDMESCGGCQFPIMGEARGEDCTAKAGVDTVSVSPTHTSVLASPHAVFLRSALPVNAERHPACEASS